MAERSTDPSGTRKKLIFKGGSWGPGTMPTSMFSPLILRDLGKINTQVQCLNRVLCVFERLEQRKNVQSTLIAKHDERMS